MRSGARPGWKLACTGVAVAMLLAPSLGSGQEIPTLPDNVLGESPTIPDSAQSPFQIVNEVQIHSEANQIRSDSSAPFASTSQVNYTEAYYDVHGNIAVDRNDNLTFAARFVKERYTEKAGETQTRTRADYRELAWKRMFDSSSFSLGRINIKNGTGYGFNPTDFFAKFSAVEQITQDPAISREVRLGSVAAQYASFSDDGSRAIAISPRLADPEPLGVADQWSQFGLGRTNAETRVLLKSTVRIDRDVEPELLAFHDSMGWKAGINLTRGIGDDTVVFLDYAGGNSVNLLDGAKLYAQETIPAGLVPMMPVDAERHFYSGMSTGANMSFGSGFSVQLAYNYYGAGLSKSDWEKWLLVEKSGNPALIAQNWYLREYASAQEVPLLKNNLFARFEAPNIFAHKVTLFGFANISLEDRSSLSSIGISYLANDVFDVGVNLYANTGSATSVYGSLPQRCGLAVRVSAHV